MLRQYFDLKMFIVSFFWIFVLIQDKETRNEMKRQNEICCFGVGSVRVFMILTMAIACVAISVVFFSLTCFCYLLLSSDRLSNGRSRLLTRMKDRSPCSISCPNKMTACSSDGLGRCHCTYSFHHTDHAIQVLLPIGKQLYLLLVHGRMTAISGNLKI